MNFEKLSKDVLSWGFERNIIVPQNQTKQALKMVSEVGELCDQIIKENKHEQKQEFGDVLVTLIILAEQLEIDPIWSLYCALSKIQNRTGQTVNGTFIKD